MTLQCTCYLCADAAGGERVASAGKGARRGCSTIHNSQPASTAVPDCSPEAPAAAKAAQGKAGRGAGRPEGATGPATASIPPTPPFPILLCPQLQINSTAMLAAPGCFWLLLSSASAHQRALCPAHQPTMTTPTLSQQCFSLEC